MGLDTKMTAAFHCVLGQQYGGRYVMSKRFKNLAIVYFNEKEHNSAKFLVYKTKKKFLGIQKCLLRWLFVFCASLNFYFGFTN